MRWLLLVILALAAAVIVLEIPEMVRYGKMKRM
jgi:hypothetical protein